MDGGGATEQKELESKIGTKLLSGKKNNGRKRGDCRGRVEEKEERSWGKQGRADEGNAEYKEKT